MGTHDFRHLGDKVTLEKRLRLLETDIDAMLFCNDTVRITNILHGLIKIVQEMEETQRREKATN